MSSNIYRGPRTLGLRLWHWSNSLVIFALILTVFLRDYLIGVREHAKLLVDKTTAAAIAVPVDLARDIAHSYLDRLWDWHVDLGLFLLFLLLARVVVEFVAPTGSGLYTKIKGAFAKKGDKDAQKFAMVKLSHVGFYALLTVTVSTGVICAYGQGWGVPDPVRHALREVHEWSMYVIIAFIAAHIIGVISAEKTTDPGLVSDMINGG
jgi:cytochrome b561